MLDHAHDAQERKDILTIVINGKGKSSDDILQQCTEAEARSIHRLADVHHEEKQRHERTPTPIEPESDIDAYDEESDDEHPEMKPFESMMQEKAKGYIPTQVDGIDENAENYINPDWLITKDEDFSDEDPFDDLDNNADPEFRALALEMSQKNIKKA